LGTSGSGRPVILATLEVEIRRITVQSQSRKIVQETLFQKYPTQNRVGKVAEVVKHLPSKHEALARHWWLIPVVLATQEAEIRRIKV
jgi:hypothetical protein